METLQEKIGRKIKQLRQEKRPKLTQARLAEKVGVETNTVWMWENGRSLPEGPNLEALAKALKCEVSDLYRPLTPTPDFKPSLVLNEPKAQYGPDKIDLILSTLQNMNLSQKESDLVGIFKLLNSKGQDIVLDFARTTLTRHARRIKA